LATHIFLGGMKFCNINDNVIMMIMRHYLFDNLDWRSTAPACRQVRPIVGNS